MPSTHKLIFVASILMIAATFSEAFAESEVDQLTVFATGNDNYIRAVAVGDVDALMKHYAQDAIQMPPGAPNIVGAVAIRQSWEAYFAEYEVIEAESWVDEVIVSDDRAFAHGHYTQKARSRTSGFVVRESGRFAESAKRLHDGTWIMTSEIWNLEGPLVKED